MDIQLPEVSGLQVTQWLKDDPDAGRHSGRRHHRLRHEGRRGEDPPGRLRGLSLQTDFGGEIPGNGPEYSCGPTVVTVMTARVLVVDDLLPNIKTARSAADGGIFRCACTATNGPEALKICERGDCDHRPARRDDAGHGRFRGLPQAQGQSGNPASAGVMVTALDQTCRPRARSRRRRRRFSHQADRRDGPDRPRALAVAARRSRSTSCARARRPRRRSASPTP